MYRKYNYKNYLFKKRVAYTLAETLVTLAILGVVAAITIPTVINKTIEKTTVVKVLKGYGLLANAYEIAIVENGPVLTWTSELMSERINRHRIFYNYLNPIKVCESSDDECFVSGNIVNLKGETISSNWPGNPSAMLKNGASIAMTYHSLSCEGSDDGVCSIIYYDIDGPKKGPNQLGKDIFKFLMKKNEITAKMPAVWNVCAIDYKWVTAVNGSSCTD